MLPMTGMSALVTVPVARRNVVRVPLIIGALVALAVSMTLRLLGVGTSLPIIVVVMVAFGLTVSLCSVGHQGALYAQSPVHDVGTAAGLLRTFSYLGAILSSSLISLSYADGVTDAGLHVIADVLIAGSAVLVLVTVLDRSLPTHRPPVTVGRRPSGVQPTVSRPLSSQTLDIAAPDALTAATASGSVSDPFAVTAAT